MAQWLEQPLSGGAVITRAQHLLGADEFTEIRHLRYKRGDTVQLHRDVGQGLHSDIVYWGGDDIAEGTEFTDMAYLGIEGKQDWLVSKRRVEDQVRLFFAPARGGYGNYWRRAGNRQTDPEALQDIPYRSDYLGVVHLGGQFLLGHGANQGLLIKNPEDSETIFSIGMKAPIDAVPALAREVTPSVDWLSINQQRLRFNGDRNVAGMRELDVSITTGSRGAPSKPNSLEEIGSTAYDSYIYFFTEYDAENDVESRPYGVHLVGLVGSAVSSTRYSDIPPTWLTKITNSTVHPNFGFSAYVKRNRRTTHVRLYRWALGSYTSIYDYDPMVRYVLLKLVCPDVSYEVLDYGDVFIDRGQIVGDTFPLGGMVGQLELTDDPDVDQIIRDTLGGPGEDGPGRTWDYYLDTWKQTPPNAWDLGAHFQGAVVLNDLTNPTVIQYSIPGLPEYFPAVNVLPIITKGKDEVLAFHRVLDYLYVVTRDNVHRVNYLPTDTDPPDEPLSLVSTEGGVARKASTVITLPQGNGLVWLSDSQLNLTTGAGSVNVCEDWSVEAAGLDVVRLGDAILHNNQAQGRLELWAWADGQQVVYHFYYTKEHLKPTGFKLTGPHNTVRRGLDQTPGNTAFDPIVSSVEGNGAQRTSRVWLLSANASYVANEGRKQDDLYLGFRKILGLSNPNTRISIQRQGLYHTPLSDYDETADAPIDFYLRYTTKSRNMAPVEGKRIRFTSLTEEEWDSNAVRGVSGNWVRPELILEGREDVSFGPMMFDVEVAGDAS